MFNYLSSITQYLRAPSVTSTRPDDNAGVSNPPSSKSPAAFALRSPQHNHGCAAYLQRTRLAQAYLLNNAKSGAEKDAKQFFWKFDASNLTEESCIELARFVLEKNPRALGENIQKLQISDEGARIALARRLAEKDRWTFIKDIKNFEISCETALIKLADLIKLEVKPLPSSIAHKSLDAIAQESGVPIKSLEAYLKKEIGAFADKMKNEDRYPGEEYFPLFDKIYNLYIIAAKQENKDLPLPWMKNLKNYDAFIGHFCPSANAKARACITKQVETFVRCKVSSGIILHDDERKEAFGVDGTTWKKHHTYGRSHDGPSQACVHEHWVDTAILAEVAQLKESGFPNRKDHLFHDTGSAALEGIGEAGAILSARQARQSKSKVVTGEYACYISSHDGETSMSGRKGGLENVYTSDDGLASGSYTTQRWFDECPVTFGIDSAKQKEYNETQGTNEFYNYRRSKEGIVVGPKVPLENVIAVSAPKEHEVRVQAWIQQYCPWVKFISKEAATIMEM